MFGDQPMNITATYSVFDTGTSLSLIPTADFMMIASYLSDNFEIDLIQ